MQARGRILVPAMNAREVFLAHAVIMLVLRRVGTMVLVLMDPMEQVRACARRIMISMSIGFAMSVPQVGMARIVVGVASMRLSMCHVLGLVLVMWGSQVREVVIATSVSPVHTVSINAPFTKA